MQANRVNIDFEFELFQDHYDPFHQQNRKFCREFEFVFFFMEKNLRILSTDRKYEEDYLERITELTGKFEIVPFDLKSLGWWGSLENIPQEKKLNSKITSFEIAKELGLQPKNSYLMKDADSYHFLNENLNGPCLLKNPFEMSGRGQRRTSFEKMLEDQNQHSKDRYPYILEPLHHIMADYGVRADINKKTLSFVELFNSSGGQFVGGQQVEKPFDFNEDSIWKVVNRYQEMGAQKGIQIDCYRHSQGIRYLVEANHRKTMGDFIQSLTQLFGKGKLISCSVSEEHKGKGILLSPPGNMKKWYYEVQ